jgi:predicted phage-related endonuclease
MDTNTNTDTDTSTSTKKSVVFWEIKQGSEEWLAMRKCFLTASEFATVLGWNPYKTVDEYTRELYSGKPEHKPNKRQVEAMQWGTTHEDDAGMTSVF